VTLPVAGLVWFLLAQPACAFDLQGHRGARGLAPENTLPAFAAALTLGVTTLELDTAITNDGIVVISHDSRLNPDITRTKDGRWLAQRGPAIYSLTWDELRQYDVGRLKPGTEYAKRYPQQRPADGAHIPRLVDLFSLVARSGNARVRLNLETKISPFEPVETPDPETFARTLIAVIRHGGMASRASIQSFDWRTLQVVQRIAPEIPTVYLTAQRGFLDNIAVGHPAGSAWTSGFQHKDYGSVPRMIKAAGGTIWSPYHGDLSNGKLKEAHDLGLTVVVWTVNDPVHIEQLIDLGVDGIITDRPDLARRIMVERGMGLPLATPVAP